MWLYQWWLEQAVALTEAPTRTRTRGKPTLEAVEACLSTLDALPVPFALTWDVSLLGQLGGDLTMAVQAVKVR